MKSFKEYLTESKKIYEFKVKIAGECPKGCAALIKQALAKYDVASCSAGKGTPIQEHHEEFPGISNIELTVFDVVTNYPVNSLQVRSAISETANISAGNIIVRTAGEQAEYNINHANDAKSGEALLGTDYEKSNNQDMVGEKHLMSFLKDLSKSNHEGETYTGVNDQLLAKKSPTEKATVDTTKTGTVSAIGSKKVKFPELIKGK
jgi:hypothetical protein